MFRKTMSAAVGGLFLLTLAACGGGGGGDDGPATTGDLTAANYESRADASVDTTLATTDFENGNIAVPQAVGARPLDGKVSIGSVSQLIARRVLADNYREQPMAGEPVSVPCDWGGRILMSGQFSNPPRSGQTITLQAENCQDNEDDEPVNGSITATVTRYAEDGPVYSLGLRMVFSHFGSEDQHVSGSASFSLTYDRNAGEVVRSEYVFKGLAVTTPSGTLQWHHGVRVVRAGDGDQLSLNGHIQIDGDYYALEQNQPFHAVSGMPESGKLTVVDKDGDRLEIVAGADRFTYTFYAKGSTSPTATSVRLHSEL
ncbi:hypothetical protein OOT46_12180 [Aquabacterium sp. A7-Y]|uniref:hypothetical protein n=1 Tax=Aquabacterium sp. A7-Y TaxID=1349605 RepID=UPI00223E5C5F|nr:hypothetical protein [Aquabacterium sp. A7-Y]MCW7538600.1 hypothetical protein [Aquabacterium sp. A7-Y]